MPKEKNTVSHLPEHGPIDENGREILLSLKNVDITFGKGDTAVRAVKNASFDIYKGETFSLVGESFIDAYTESCFSLISLICTFRVWMYDLSDVMILLRSEDSCVCISVTTGLFTECIVRR